MLVIEDFLKAITYFDVHHKNRRVQPITFFQNDFTLCHREN